MLDLLEPDWNLNGDAAATDLHLSVQRALVEELAELKAPPSGLRSRLLRALPTTMAMVALQRTQSGGSTWAAHVFWAGDSRAYVVEAAGVRQLSADDLRDQNDAMRNLSRDSVVSNAMSADTEFHVNYRRVELEAPFLVVCATDGCFGYLPTPMHFEHLLLAELLGAGSANAWALALQQRIAAVTGDDASMSVLGVGAQYAAFQGLLRPRLEDLDGSVVGPLDDLREAVLRAQRELETARALELATTDEVWRRYQAGYELYLHSASGAPAEGGADTSALESAEPESGPTQPADAAEATS